MPTSNEDAAFVQYLADQQIPEAQRMLQIMIARERSKNRLHAANQLEWALQKW